MQQQKYKLASVAVAGLMAMGATTAAHAVASYGNISVPPGVYFGLGNVNGNFTIDTANGIQIGLRAKDRGEGHTLDGSSGIYHADAGLCNPLCSGGPKADWNYEFSVYTGPVDGVGGMDISNFVIRLRIDTDPGLGTSYVTIQNAFDNWGDNEYWNGATKRKDIGSGPNTGLGPQIGETGVQQSVNPLFGNSGFQPGFNPFAAGLYNIELTVLDTAGNELAETAINVQIPEPGLLGLLGIGLAGLGFARRKLG